MAGRTILFTGLVRDPGRFNELLDTIENARRHAAFDLVYSTWFDELSKYPELQMRLHKLGAHIVEQEPPTLVLPGHILHQISAIHLGLSVVDDDDFVLKLRPDLSNNADIHDFLASAPIPVAPARLFATPFRDKFHIRAAFGAHPFYVNDITIAGRAADLKRLCLVPFVALMRFSRLAPEQILWAPHFAHPSPVLSAYLSVNVGLIFNNREGFAAARQVLMESPLYARALACAAVLFQDNFSFLGPDPLRPTAPQFARSQTLEALLWDQIDTPYMLHNPTCFTNSLRTGGLTDAIANGSYLPSAFGDRVAAAVAAGRAPNALRRQHHARAELEAEATALGERIHRDVGVMGMKFMTDAPRHRTTRGARPNWSIAQDPDARTKALEVEVNMLRRTIDGLNVRLSNANA